MAINSENQKVCAKCGSKLVEIEKTTKQLGNSQFPIISISYRCTNSSCQESIDKQVIELDRQRQERSDKVAAKKAAIKTQ